jgi:hypothetical protein
MAQTKKPKVTNPHAKRVTPEEAYEYFERDDGAQIWILKRYQHPEKEAGNLYARVYTATKSSGTFGSYSYGDAYIHNIVMASERKDNPLCSYACCCMDAETSVEVVEPLQKYRFQPMRINHPMLVNYIRIAVPKTKMAEFKQFAEKYALRLICTDSDQELALCLADLDSQRFKQIEEEGGQLY